MLQRDRVPSLLSSKYLKSLASAPRNPWSSVLGWCLLLCQVRHQLPPSLCSKTTVNRGSTTSNWNISYSEPIFSFWRGDPGWCLWAGAVSPQPRTGAGDTTAMEWGPGAPRGEDCWWSEPCLLSYGVSQGHPGLKRGPSTSLRRQESILTFMKP